MTGPDGRNLSHYPSHSLIITDNPYHITMTSVTQHRMGLCCSLVTVFHHKSITPHPHCISLLKDSEICSPLRSRAYCIPSILWVASEDNLFPPRYHI